MINDSKIGNVGFIINYPKVENLKSWAMSSKEEKKGYKVWKLSSYKKYIYVQTTLRRPLKNIIIEAKTKGL